MFAETLHVSLSGNSQTVCYQLPDWQQYFDVQCFEPKLCHLADEQISPIFELYYHDFTEN